MQEMGEAETETLLQARNRHETKKGAKKGEAETETLLPARDRQETYKRGREVGGRKTNVTLS